MMIDTVKYLLMAVASTGLLAACTSGSTVGDDPAEECAVKFEAREASRASVITNSTLTDNAFAVYGDIVRTSGGASPRQIFDGTQVTHTADGWSYGTPQYWFPGYSYSFVAVCPVPGQNISDLNYENNRLAFTYSPSGYQDASDVLIATHRRRYTEGNSSTVAFKFRHTLSRLNFVAQVDPDSEDDVMIERLALNDVVTGASYEIIPASISSGSETDDYTLGTWTLDEATRGNAFVREEGILLMKGERKDLFPVDSDPLIVIPQEVTTDMEVEIIYHYALSPDSKVVTSARLFPIANTNHGGKWDAGKSYTYHFSLGANAFVIYSVPEVEDWKDAEGGNYVITD